MGGMHADHADPLKGGRRLARRELLGRVLAAFAAPSYLALCRGHSGRETRDRGDEMTRDESTQSRPSGRAEGRLLARPGALSSEARAASAQAGLRPLRLDAERDALLYVPRGYGHERPAPLALMLHGAGGDERHGVSLLQRLADEFNLLLLAPASREATWDVISRGRYGADVRFIDRALENVFARYAVDPKRVAVGGFSDGASYALSLGVTNGDLFTHVLAYSPGFMAPAAQRGAPRLYVSHGTDDRVLPIDRCSRRLVPRLKEAGYGVLYREFEGPHTVPPQIARESLEWFLPSPQRGRGGV